MKRLINFLKDIFNSPMKFLWNSIGAVITILLFGKNFFDLDAKESLLYGVLFYILIVSLYILIYLIKEIAKGLHKRFIESTWGEAIIILKEAYSEIHYLRKQPYEDKEMVETLQVLCDKLKQIFDKKTRSCCSVSIKVPICEVSNMESLVFKNLCRDSQHRQRDTEQYRSVSHTVIGNTPYLQIVNALLTHSDNLGYINNNVDNDDDYLNTSKPCYSDGILPYKSELVYPIIPVKNENGTYNMCGFVCVDCEKANAFDKSLYDLPLIQGVADGIYDIIFNRIKGKNHEQ